MRTAYFERFTLDMTRAQALGASHAGACDSDVAQLLEDPKISQQLDSIGAEAIRAELAEYGAWEDSELASEADNRARIVWLAAGSIREESSHAR